MLILNNLESGNILSLNSNIELKFSKFSSKNEITNLNIKTIFDKHNPFKIKIFYPLNFYIEGMVSMLDNSEQKLKLKELLEKHPLQKDDSRFQMHSYKLFNINTLEEACEILQILLNGETVIYDDYHKKYRGYSSILNFNNENGLSNEYNYNKDVYQTFEIS